MKQIEKLLAKTISGTNFENHVYLVGGYVRDQIIGKESKDIDLVVDLDNGGIKLANFLYKNGIGSQPIIFKNFGTSQVRIRDYKLEFVMTRSESYRAKDRKPEVRHASLEEDVKRRDFTINSLLKNISTGEFLDITKLGKEDIQNKIIRTISDPTKVFTEDPLRMLRAIRFAVQLDFRIIENTWRAIILNSKKINNISTERIRDEFNLILLSPDPPRGIQLLINSKLLDQFIPEISSMKNVQQNKYHDKDVFDHTLAVLDNTRADLELRLAALFHDIAKPITRCINKTGVHFYDHEKVGTEMTQTILKRMKYSKETISLVSKLIYYHLSFKSFGKDLKNLKNKHLRKFLFKVGKDSDLLLDLMHADNLAHASAHSMPEQIPKIKKKLAELETEITEKKLPVSGKDIIFNFRIEPGKKVGKMLKQATDIWLENPNWDKEKILNFISRGGKMNDSKTREKVHDAVVKAIHTGEDVLKAVRNITKEIIKTSKTEDLSTKEKVETLTKEALQGAKDGYTKAKPPTEEFLKKASKTINETIKENAPKVAHFAQEVYQGIVSGTKDFLAEKKQRKTESEEENEETE